MDSSSTPNAKALHPIEEYWMALGKFVNEFARLENTMQILLMFQAGVSHETATAIFSGTRMDQGMSFIKRLREAHGKPITELMERTFSQIAVITKARNDILHHGAQFPDAENGLGVVSNHMRALPNKSQSFPISAEILNDLTDDVWTVMQAIAVIMTDGLPVPKEITGAFQQGAHRPWRYKPSSQAHTRQPRNEKKNKPKAQRQSSPE